MNLEQGKGVALNITANMEVSKDDLIAIKVASHEKDLTEKETATRKEIDSIKKQITQANKELKEEGEKLTLVICEDETVKAVIAGLITLGMKEACASVSDIAFPSSSDGS